MPSFLRSASPQVPHLAGIPSGLLIFVLAAVVCSGLGPLSFVLVWDQHPLKYLSWFEGGPHESLTSFFSLPSPFTGSQHTSRCKIQFNVETDLKMLLGFILSVNLMSIAGFFSSKRSTKFPPLP